MSRFGPSTPSRRVLNFFVWVNCISGVSFLCCSSRRVRVCVCVCVSMRACACLSTAGRDTQIQKINIWFLCAIYKASVKAPLWQLSRVVVGRGGDTITGRGAEFKCSQLLLSRVYDLRCATRGKQSSARFLINCILQCGYINNHLNMACVASCF